MGRNGPSPCSQEQVLAIGRDVAELSASALSSQQNPEGVGIQDKDIWRERAGCQMDLESLRLAPLPPAGEDALPFQGSCDYIRPTWRSPTSQSADAEP